MKAPIPRAPRGREEGGREETGKDPKGGWKVWRRLSEVGGGAPRGLPEKEGRGRRKRTNARGPGPLPLFAAGPGCQALPARAALEAMKPAVRASGVCSKEGRVASSRLRQGLSHLGYQETWTRDGRTALDTRSSLQPRVDLAPAEALSGQRGPGPHEAGCEHHTGLWAQPGNLIEASDPGNEYCHRAIPR